MRTPLAQPITLDFDQVWLLKTARGRQLLDVLSSGEISALLAGKVDTSDGRLSDSRPPTVHGATAHDATVEAVANKNQASGYPGLDASGLLDGTQQLYGTAASTACQGNDSRLSDARTPTTHGASKHDSTVEATANKNQANGYAGLDGSSKLTGSQVSYGSSANTACQGNDSRLSDVRTPTSHDSSKHDSTVEATAHKGAASGYCDLDSGSKVPTARLGTGSADATTFLRGDRTWAAPGASSVGLVPVGAILAWHKNWPAPSLPPEFLECNGQTISDADSPLNGEAVPDLNATHCFLRGHTVSGDTGGSETHSHTIPFLNHNLDSPDAGGSGDTLNGDATDAASSLPPYAEVVWIIRIK